MTTSMIIFVVAVAGLCGSRFIPCTAFIAMGVAALPNPSRFALMFMEMYLPVSSLSPGNSLRTTGRSSFASRSEAPVRERISNSPSHIPYSAISVRASDTASFAPVIIASRTDAGSVISSAAMDRSIIISHMILIIIKYVCVLLNIIV